MSTPQLAAIIEYSSSNTAHIQLTRVLDFLGISWQVYRNTSDLAEAAANGVLRNAQYAVLSPLSALSDLLLDSAEKNGLAQTILKSAHSLFIYSPENTREGCELLRTLTTSVDARLVPVRDESVEVAVSNRCPEFTGPMHAVRIVIKSRPCDHALLVGKESPVSTIIDSKVGAFFVDIRWKGLRSFISCSSEIPDLNEPLNGSWYDVKDHFLSAVPLFVYLKWAFRNSCWQPHEAGACLIIDDPVLKLRYGFCDFRQLDAQMQEHAFSTSIAFIPWNWTRTVDKMAALIRGSEGRLSICVHGCDHTDREFAIREVPILEGKLALAKRRMELHREKTNISHDLIMVFPQGVFSRESFDTLPEHQFIAAVNTEVLPEGGDETFTIGESWSVAILKYRGFPLFTRHYPSHGLENFAFDLLLGKPCLIVEHHHFFKQGGGSVIRFIDALNSLHCNLRWRTLGEVIRRSYQWRMSFEGIIEIRMFANELLLDNKSDTERSYQVRKANHDNARVKTILANGSAVEWETHKDVIMFSCTLGPGTEMLICVQYYPSATVPVKVSHTLESRARVALRRYASELRDNVLSQSTFLLFLAQRAKRLFGGR